MRVRVIDSDIETGRMLVQALGQGWYYGPTKHGIATYVRVRWVKPDELHELSESTTSSQAADSIIKTF